MSWLNQPQPNDTSQTPLHSYANDARTTHQRHATSSRSRFPVGGFWFRPRKYCPGNWQGTRRASRFSRCLSCSAGYFSKGASFSLRAGNVVSDTHSTPYKPCRRKRGGAVLKWPRLSPKFTWGTPPEPGGRRQVVCAPTVQQQQRSQFRLHCSVWNWTNPTAVPRAYNTFWTGKYCPSWPWIGWQNVKFGSASITS